MEARVLGPLEIVVGDTQIEIPGGKQRELLAILLIHANEILSTDTLVDGLWGESPPSSALKTLQALVSRLRGTLGSAGEALETHGHGYRLRLESGELDSDVFYGALEEARRARSRGEPERASEQLRQALGLWRGPALAGVPIRRLRAIGDCPTRRAPSHSPGKSESKPISSSDATMSSSSSSRRSWQNIRSANGCAASSCLRCTARSAGGGAPELPGWAAHALGGAWHRAERKSTPTRAPDPRARPDARCPRASCDGREARTRSPWRHPRTIVVVGALMLAAAVGAAAFLATRDDHPVQAAGLRALDPESGDVIESVPLGTTPSAVSVGEGGVWVLDADDRTVSEIDPETRAVGRTFSTSSTPTDIAAGAGGVWIGSTTSDIGVFPSSVSRIDPGSGLLVETVELPPTRILPQTLRREQPTAPRRCAGCRLGDQPRSHRLTHRPAIEQDRRPGQEGPGREHRNRRRRRLDHRGQHRHRDRRRHEHGRTTPDAEAGRVSR